MENTVFVEEPLHGSNLIVGGTLGERAHQLYNEGDGKHMVGDYILCGLLRLPEYLVV